MAADYANTCAQGLRKKKEKKKKKQQREARLTDAVFMPCRNTVTFH